MKIIKKNTFRKSLAKRNNVNGNWMCSYEEVPMINAISDIHDCLDAFEKRLQKQYGDVMNDKEIPAFVKEMV